MENEKSNSYIENIYRYGKIWGLIIFTVILAVPFVIALTFKAAPKWDGLVKGIIGVLPIYWTVGVIEIFTYVPMLGAGGSYLSFVTGNISNLKLPCALDALDKANVKASSEEGEIISTISIAVSSIVTTLIIIIGVILFIPISKTGILETPQMTSAFSQILPALFGGLGVVFVSKNIKLAVPPLVIMMLLFIFIDGLNAGTVAIMVPVGVIFTIAYARIMYKKGLL